MNEEKKNVYLEGERKLSSTVPSANIAEEIFQLKDILSCIYFFREEIDKAEKRIQNKIHYLENHKY